MTKITDTITIDRPRFEALERRLAELEQRFDPSADYNEPEDGDPAGCMLWASSHDQEGKRRSARRPEFVGTEFEGECWAEPLPDLRDGFLRPATMAQVGDCLAVLADWTMRGLDDQDRLDAGIVKVSKGVRKLSRAVRRRK